jgi:hypothetical protein
VRAYVGPTLNRGIDQAVSATIDGAKPWFEFATAAAAPRRLHLAKVTILSDGKGGWSRNLEIDGHDVAYEDRNWLGGVPCSDVGYLTRYALFEFPVNSKVIAQRTELERAIEVFAEKYAEYESIDELIRVMVKEGFDADLVRDVESISTIAFGRTMFERHGVQYSTTVIRARRNGRVETSVPLMSLPAYTRARALAGRLFEKLGSERYQALCLYHAESSAILKAINDMGDAVDLSQLRLYPSVLPDAGVSDETMDKAMAALRAMNEEERLANAVEVVGRPVNEGKKKAWWKIW